MTPLGPMDERGNLPRITREDVDGFGLRLKTPEERVADFEASVREWAARAPVIGDTAVTPEQTAAVVLAAAQGLGVPAVAAHVDQERGVVVLDLAVSVPAIVSTLRVA